MVNHYVYCIEGRAVNVQVTPNDQSAFVSEGQNEMFKPFAFKPKGVSVRQENYASSNISVPFNNNIYFLKNTQFVVLKDIVNREEKNIDLDKKAIFTAKGGLENMAETICAADILIDPSCPKKVTIKLENLNGSVYIEAPGEHEINIIVGEPSASCFVVCKCPKSKLVLESKKPAIFILECQVVENRDKESVNYVSVNKERVPDFFTHANAVSRAEVVLTKKIDKKPNAKGPTVHLVKGLACGLVLSAAQNIREKDVENLPQIIAKLNALRDAQTREEESEKLKRLEKELANVQQQLTQEYKSLMDNKKTGTSQIQTTTFNTVASLLQEFGFEINNNDINAPLQDLLISISNQMASSRLKSQDLQALQEKRDEAEAAVVNGSLVAGLVAVMTFLSFYLL